jgi:hypothetical protein
LSEAQDAQGHHLGESGLTARVAARRTEDLRTLLNGVLTEAKSFTGGNLDDDLTLFALDYRG